MKMDHDEIRVTASEGKFNAIALGVKGAGIHLISAKIIFGNGEEKLSRVDRFIKPGTRTAPIDLAGNQRVIRKIVFNYCRPARQGSKRAAVVSIYGRH